MNFWHYPCSLHSNIIRNKRKKKTKKKTFKISTSMFSTTDKTFHNHHFISTHCNYSRFPITRTLANSNQNRFPLDFLHTFPVILPSVIRTLNNSNLPLTRSNFCFPSDHLYINLTSKTRTIFWALIKSGKKKQCTGVRNIEFWIFH